MISCVQFLPRRGKEAKRRHSLSSGGKKSSIPTTTLRYTSVYLAYASAVGLLMMASIAVGTCSAETKRELKIENEVHFAIIIAAVCVRFPGAFMKMFFFFHSRSDVRE